MVWDLVRLWQLVNVNIASTTMMTHMILPTMLERGRGAIINVSSALGDAPPTPLLAAEAASMSFVTMLGRTLHDEYHHKGITVQRFINIHYYCIGTDTTPPHYRGVLILECPQ
uniref:Uncharacterized protein n=1 Tax=Amphimedon queenslandica TaxID=400682 RepID=A0A1X7TN67_AMPQE